MSQPQFGSLAGIGWEWVNLAYLAGGLVLLRLRVINWHIPLAFIASLLVMSTLATLFRYNCITISSSFVWRNHVGRVFHCNRSSYGLYHSEKDASVWRIYRCYGLSFAVGVVSPDGVAFAVLLANMCVPLIDYYTKPRTYGH